MCAKRSDNLPMTVLLSALTAFVFLLLCSMCSPLYPLNIWDDANCLLTVGRVMKEGGVLYRDVYEQKGPMLYLIHMLAAMISDASFMGVFFFEVISFTSVLVFAQKLICLWTNDRFAWAGTMLFGECVLVSRSFARGDSAEEFCLPFLMAALYIVCAHAKRSDKALPAGTMLMLGILAGCVAAVKYTALGLFVGLCAAQGIYQLVRRDVRGVFVSAGAFLAGMLLPVLPWVIYFSAHGALKDAFTAYIYNNIFLYNASERGLLDIAKEIGRTGWQNISWSLLAAGGVMFVIAGKREGVYLRFAAALGAMAAGAAIFLPGTVYPYYPLVLCVFAPFALALLLEKAECVLRTCRILVPASAILSVIAVMLFSPNAFLRGVKLEDTAQGKLAAQMEEGASLLQYSHLDDGLYLTHGVLPEEKYFVLLNVAYQEMRNALDDAVREGRPDYVLVSWRELPEEFDRYTLVARETGYDDENRMNKDLYLYRRIEE